VNLFQESEKENFIFKNEDVFNQGYVPEDMIHREKEVREMVFSLKDISKGKEGNNLFIFGLREQGKVLLQKMYLSNWKSIQELLTRYISIAGITTQDILY